MPKWLRRAPVLLLLALVPLAAEVRSLTILHTNDIHARLTPAEDGTGGFARLAGAIRQERANCKDCILLNIGDLVQGTPVSTIFHGLPVYEIANLFGFDAASLGNHEFDYGWIQARKFIQTAKYPIVNANLVDSKGRLFTPKPYVIVKVNKLKVALLGALTDMRNLSTPQLMGEWHTLPAAATLRKYAAELKPKADLIVLLGHLDPIEERQVLDTVPDIPVILSGHTHTGMPEPAARDRRVLVRVKSDSQELGRLELKVDTMLKAPVSWSWKRIPINASIPPAADVEAQVKHWEKEVAARVDQPLAVSRQDFSKEQVRALMERAMCEQTGANFAFINSGGVRATLPKGQLLVRNIWDIMPFDNRLVIAQVKGRDLPAVVVQGKKVDPDRTYTLAVSDFTAANQSAPSQLRTTGLKFDQDVGLLRDVLVDWFRKKKVIE